MRLFNIEAHISVIADVENLFAHLYPEVEITSWNISDHSWVFEKKPATIEVVNQHTWRFIDHGMIIKFQKRYDNFLRTFDGFICGFPPVFSLLFEKYNKPIFLVNATRYEMPFCWEPNPEMQSFYEKKLLEMQQKGQLIAVSNNKADVEYLRRATGVKSQHIPSICRYTNAKYAPKKKEFIFFGKAKVKPISDVIYYKDLGKYSWEDLYSYKGIIHLPYEISTMSIFEHYSASVPLLMPTKRLLKQFLKNKRIPFNGPYTRYANTEELEADLQEVLGEDWHDFWLDRADFYDSENMPFISYYDHIGEIPEIMSNLDTDAISKRMKSFNKRRLSRALQDWKRLIEPHYCSPHAEQVVSQGQINMNSKFGIKIHNIAKNIGFNSFFEIGTWNGEGSTACIMNALISRADNSRLYSLELMPEMYEKAKQFWSWLPQSKFSHQLVLLNGKVIDEGLMIAKEIKAHPAFPKIKAHYDLYYQSDVEFFEKATNVSSFLPREIDVVILDGGEFCSYAEFEFVKTRLDPKVIILDDTNIIKCSRARAELLKDKDWHCFYDDLNDRHGAAIFVRNDIKHLI